MRNTNVASKINIQHGICLTNSNMVLSFFDTMASDTHI